MHRIHKGAAQSSCSFLMLAAFQLARRFRSGFRTLLHTHGRLSPGFRPGFHLTVFTQSCIPGPREPSRVSSCSELFVKVGLFAGLRPTAESTAVSDGFCGGKCLTEGRPEPGDNEVSGDRSATPTPHADDIHRFESPPGFSHFMTPLINGSSNACSSDVCMQVREKKNIHTFFFL